MSCWCYVYQKNNYNYFQNSLINISHFKIHNLKAIFKLIGKPQTLFKLIDIFLLQTNK